MKLSESQWRAIFAAERKDGSTGTFRDFGNELRSVVYVLALEGASSPDPAWGFLERALDSVVQTMQPAPSTTHIELCMAPSSRRDDMHFSTYLGSKAGWGASFGGQREFYLGHNAARWRAVPIVCHDASARLRVECAKHVGTPYSLAKYICALPPIRALAGLLSDVPQVPAHCAILTARCLKAALPEIGINHPPAWFGPATLFLELDSEQKRAAFHEKLLESDPIVRAISEDEGETHALHELLNGADENIEKLDQEACVLALHRLTVRSLAQGLDDVARRIVQKQLATALLRFSIVRNS